MTESFVHLSLYLGCLTGFGRVFIDIKTTGRSTLNPKRVGGPGDLGNPNPLKKDPMTIM